jgi:hypothetical protein
LPEEAAGAKKNEFEANLPEAKPGTPAAKKPAPADDKSSLLKTPANQIRGAFKDAQAMTPGPTPTPFV